MSEQKSTEHDSQAKDSRIEAVRNFLCGYQLCRDMLNLRQYERKRASYFEEECVCDDILAGNETTWRTRMQEIGNLIAGMKNGREKVILYYHYIKGESIEHSADILGVSRRTGYRIHQRGLLMISFLYERMKKTKNIE